MLTQKIKTLSLEARKAHDRVKSDLLVTLLSDIQMIGKNDGNREPTDGDAIITIKKYIKNTEEVLSVLTNIDPHADPAPVVKLHLDAKALLESLLPKQLSNVDLHNEISKIIFELQTFSKKDMGKVMKVLKERHGGLYDGAVASEIVKNILN